MGHRCLQIIAERFPARQDRPAFDAGFQQPERARLGDLQGPDHPIAKPFAAQCPGIGRQQRPDSAEPGDQCLGLGLGVAAGNGEGEQIFDQLMIEQGLFTAFKQPLAKAGSMAIGITRQVGHAASPFRIHMPERSRG